MTTDLFSNIHVTGTTRYLSGDIAGKGKDKTVLYVWEGLRVIYIYKEDITDQDKLYEKIIELKQKYNIPTSNIILDYDGIGVGIVDRLKCKGFQANATAFTTQEEQQQGLKANFKNLRSQCWFKLAELVNDALVYIECNDQSIRDLIVEELDVIKEVNDGSDQKRQIISKGSVSKEDENKVTIRNLLGRSPDFGDGLMMRCYFEVAKMPEPGVRLL